MSSSLRDELGGDLAALDLLTEQESADILELLQEARRGQKKSLDAALDEALGHLPRLIRGSARKMLFG